jgi:phospholipase C
MSGSDVGIYATSGSLLNPTKECMLESSDAGKTITNNINKSTFNISLPSGACSTSVNRLADHARITNIFVLMLENHSFDHLFGFSGFNNITGLTGNESNTFNGTTYKTSNPAVDPMPTGPGHEFLDTLEQLCGAGTANPFPAGPYPPINNSGFVASYSGVGAASGNLGDVMKCCSTSSQVPMIYKLAQNFALCNNWYSSMPGPTWPNRLFAMGASSAGLDDSPSNTQTVEWETVDGFTYPNGSIFDKLTSNGKSYRLYNDYSNIFSSLPAGGNYGGQVPIVSGLNGIQMWDVNDVKHFGADLNSTSGYPYQFTWIEPNYGFVMEDFQWGSSQHPMDSLTAGEKLIAAVYDAIRTSPYWATSVLFITYDEHGGYYDSVAPPAAIPPGDDPPAGLNTHGFDFSQYGIRVPAVVVSPLTFKGLIVKETLDHTSILKTLETTWGMTHLTNRDKNATDLTSVLSGTIPRADGPIVISTGKISGNSTTSSFAAEPEEEGLASTDDISADDDAVVIPNDSLAPGIDAPRTNLSSADLAKLAESDAKPLPERGNIHGFLHAALKAEVAMSDGSDIEKQAIIDNYKATVHTYGDAREYFSRILSQVETVRATKQQAAPPETTTE